MSTRRMPRAERRESILEGATRAFAAAGYRGTSMADVAKAVGITELILYRHFDSKEDLYRATLEHVPESLVEDLIGQRKSRLGIGARSVLEAARLDPGGFQLLWRHAAREPLFQSYVGSRRARAIASAAAFLAARVGEGDLDFAAHALVGYLVDSVLNWLEFGDPNRDEMFITATDAAMHEGLRVWTKLLAEESARPSRSATG